MPAGVQARIDPQTPEHTTLEAALAAQQLLEEEHRGLDLAELALVQHSIPAAHDAGVGVVKHDPAAGRVHKGVVVRAVVAHHAAQPVQARLLSLVDLRQINFLRTEALAPSMLMTMIPPTIPARATGCKHATDMSTPLQALPDTFRSKLETCWKSKLSATMPVPGEFGGEGG